MAVKSKTLQNNNLTLRGGLGKCLQAIEKQVENETSRQQGRQITNTLETSYRQGRA
jgi:hypothetical protein